MSSSIETAVARGRRIGHVEAVIAAAACAPSELHPGFEPTETNRRIWAIAHAAGVLSACEAIKAISDAAAPVTRDDNRENGCGNG